MLTAEIKSNNIYVCLHTNINLLFTSTYLTTKTPNFTLYGKFYAQQYLNKNACYDHFMKKNILHPLCLLPLFTTLLTACVEQQAAPSYSGRYELVELTYSGMGASGQELEQTSIIQDINDHPNFPLGTQVPRNLQVIQGILPIFSPESGSENNHYLIDRGFVPNRFKFRLKIAGQDPVSNEYGFFASLESREFKSFFKDEVPLVEEKYLQLEEEEKVDLGFNPNALFIMRVERDIRITPNPDTDFKPVYFNCNDLGCNGVVQNWPSAELPLTAGSLESWDAQEKTIEVTYKAIMAPKNLQHGENEYSYMSVVKAKYVMVKASNYGNLRGKTQEEAKENERAGKAAYRDSEVSENFKKFFSDNNGPDAKNNFLQLTKSLEGYFMQMYPALQQSTGVDYLGIE